MSSAAPRQGGVRRDDVEVAVVGAGPHGLSAALHLRAAGVDPVVLGDPMSFWASMPAGMLLRSNWSGTCIGDHQGPLTLDAYQAATGRSFGRPIPLQDFVDYGLWVQGQVAPDVDCRDVERLEAAHGAFTLTLADGGVLRARRVVVAAGIAPFTNRPPVAAGLPRELASHVADHPDLSALRGRRVLVVGGGQSALESSALLHEGGADVQVAVRAPEVTWLHGGVWHRRLGRARVLVYAPTDVGPLGLSRVVGAPALFRSLPRPVQERAAHRAIRPAGATWVRPRITDVPIRLGVTVQKLLPAGDGLRAEFSDGSTTEIDHVLFATGYRVDVAKYPFLPPELTARIERVNGYPLLRRGLESSVPRLHFVGAPAAWSFGPIMRFVSGGWYSGKAVARAATAAGGGPARRERSLVDA